MQAISHVIILRDEILMVCKIMTSFVKTLHLMTVQLSVILVAA